MRLNQNTHKRERERENRMTLVKYESSSEMVECGSLRQDKCNLRRVFNTINRYLRDSRKNLGEYNRLKIGQVEKQLKHFQVN